MYYMCILVALFMNKWECGKQYFLSDINAFFVWSRTYKRPCIRDILSCSSNKSKPFHLVVMETPAVLAPQPGPSDLLVHQRHGAKTYDDNKYDMVTWSEVDMQASLRIKNLFRLHLESWSPA
jgi:hypothetical protein